MEPKIRFKGFSGAWKETTISETGKCISGIGFPEQEQGGRTGIPFYKVSDMNNVGNEKVMTVSNNYVSLEQVKKNGWKVITDVPAIYFAKVGAAVLLNRKRLVLTPCLCDNNTMLFSFDKVKWDSFFCYSYFETLDLSSLVQVGSLPSYNNNIVGKINILQPIPKEQKAIGLYFKYLDDLIQSTTKKIESLKQVKAASLQSMFPQEGETKPRVRFKGFEGKWVPTLVGDCGIWSKGRLLSKEDITPKGKSKCIHYGELFTLYSEVINNVRSKTNLQQECVSQIGDILFPDSDVTPSGLARCSAIMEDGVILGGGINILKPYKHIHSPFLSYSINLEKEQIISQVTGTTVRHINSRALSDVIVILPKEIKEQIAIANYFISLDKQITLQTQRLEKLKQIKSACLDNMFV